MLVYCSGNSLRLSPCALSTNDEGRMVSSQSNMIMASPLDDGVGDDMLSDDGICEIVCEMSNYEQSSLLLAACRLSI